MWAALGVVVSPRSSLRAWMRRYGAGVLGMGLWGDFLFPCFLGRGPPLPRRGLKTGKGKGTQEERAKARSKTFPGIAKAMATQWAK